MLTKNPEELKRDHLREAEVGRALLIVNSKSRKGEENFRQVVAELAAQGIRPAEAHAVHNPRHMKPLAERLLASEQFDTLIVGGGDGTVAAMAGLIPNRPIRLGVIPLGTGNDFARNLEIQADIASAVGVIKDGYVCHVDLGRAGDHYFLNAASVGFAVEVARQIDNDLKKVLGPLAYGATAIQVFNEMRPVHVHLTFRDRPHGQQYETAEFKALQVTVANGRYYGAGLVSAPNNTVSDNKLAVTVIEAMSALELVQILPGLTDGSYVRHPKVHHYTTTDLLVETGHPRNVNLDGEICQRTPLSFQLAPASLQVFAPRP